MNPFEMVVIIVIVVVIGRVVREHLRAKSLTGGNAHQETLEDALDRIDDLEERVRVLEKVVTDDGYDLKRQIDDLK